MEMNTLRCWFPCREVEFLSPNEFLFEVLSLTASGHSSLLQGTSTALSQRYFIIIHVDNEMKRETGALFCAIEPTTNAVARMIMSRCDVYNYASNVVVVDKTEKICQKPVKTIHEVLVPWLLTKKSDFWLRQRRRQHTREGEADTSSIFNYIFGAGPQLSVCEKKIAFRVSDECQCQSEPFFLIWWLTKHSRLAIEFHTNEKCATFRYINWKKSQSRGESMVGA